LCAMNAKNPVKIRFVKKWPASEIVGLYRAGGWWGPSDRPSQIREIISGSFVFAVAVDEKTRKAVGMGRVLSDGISDAYIQDVIVSPEYRGQKLGKKIILALTDYCIKKKIGWVGLVAESGTGEFYRRLGFNVMKGHTPMKLKGV